MAIRLKNLDLGPAGMKRANITSLGDVTATRSYCFFVAPVDCVVDYIDIYSTQKCPADVLSASTSFISATFNANVNGSANTLYAFGNSGSTVAAANIISANSRFRITPSANNSLTAGSPLVWVNTQAGSQTLSAVAVHVTYTPKKHAATR